MGDPGGGVTLTTDVAVVGAASLSLVDRAESPAALWRRLVEDNPAALLSSLRWAGHDVVDDVDDPDPADLPGADVAFGAWQTEMAATIRNASNAGRLRQLLVDLGEGHIYGAPTTLHDVRDGPLALLEAGTSTPTLAILLGREWWRQRADDRERQLRWLVEDLGRAFDVRIAVSTYLLEQLVDVHRDVLPATAVNDAPTRRTHDARITTTDDEPASIDVDDDAWLVLATIDQEAAERRLLTSIRSDPIFGDVSRSTHDKRVSRLAAAGLVERVRINGDVHVRLLPAGAEAIQRYRREFADPVRSHRRARDSDARAGRSGGPAGRLEGTRPPSRPRAGATAHTQQGNPGTAPGCERPTESNPQGSDIPRARSGGPPRSAPPEGEADAEVAARDLTETDRELVALAEAGVRGEDLEESRPGARARLERTVDGGAPADVPLRLDQHHAPAAATDGADIAIVDAPVDRGELRPIDRGISFDEQREEVVVDVECHPHHWATNAVDLALALTSPDLFRFVDLVGRIDGEDGEGSLAGFVESNKVVLRKGRDLGWLPDSVESGTDYVTELAQARTELMQLRKSLYNEDREFLPDNAGEALRTALGLQGTMTHVLDLLDLDVVRHLHLPDWNRWSTASTRAALLTFLAYSTTISSRYGHYVMFRKLYETREEKRQDALQGPAVDPNDPIGEHIGRWCISGPGVDELLPDLEELTAEWDVHEEALQEGREFVVDLKVKQGTTRGTVGGALARLGRIKRLRSTPAATNLITSLTGDVHAAAAAYHRLAGEPIEPRRVDLAEVRRAVGQLPAERILPSLRTPAAEGPGISLVVRELLRADRPLSQRELATGAGVDPDTVAAHREALEALGFVDVEETGAGRPTLWRFRLPFPAERHDREPPRPRYLSDVCLVVDADDADAGLEEDRPPPSTPREWSLPWALDDVVARLGEPLDPASDIYDRIRPGSSYEIGEVADVVPRAGPLLDVVSAQVGEELGDRADREWHAGPWSGAVELGERPPATQASLSRWLSETGQTAIPGD